MTEYQETIDWLFNQIPMFQNVGSDAYKPGLEGVKALSEAFSNPHKNLRTIHVGGTNGKGSVSSLLASVLQESGLKVGLFTSPHLIDFRERIRIDGQLIPEERVVDFIKRYRSLSAGLEPSFFELTTVMAFEWFAENNVDIAVIEVGLGGRLDSTNIIQPILSVITNISFDHTAQLGNSLESIAYEKAGIIKQDAPVVIGNVNDCLRDIFIEKAKKEISPIYFSQDTGWFEDAINDGTHYIYIDTPWGDIECPLHGDYQPENTNTVLQALEVLRFKDCEAVKKGFKNVIVNTGLIGRWTVLQQNPCIVCDTGHNQGGWKWLGPRLREIADCSESLHIVAGFVNDKDLNAILQEMPMQARYYWATPSVKRGRDSKSVALAAQEFGLLGESYPSVEAALEQAMSQSSSSHTIFVGGSTYVVADLMNCYESINHKQRT